MDTVRDVELLAVEDVESPSRRARVRIAFTSEPASGSVMATAVITSPLMMPGIQRARCALVPSWKTCTEAMSVCTSVAMATPP